MEGARLVLQEVERRSDLHDGALVEHNDLVKVDDGADAVGNAQDEAVAELGTLAQGLLDLGVGLRVDCGGSSRNASQQEKEHTERGGKAHLTL